MSPPLTFRKSPLLRSEVAPVGPTVLVQVWRRRGDMLLLYTNMIWTWSEQKKKWSGLAAATPGGERGADAIRQARVITGIKIFRPKDSLETRSIIIKVLFYILYRTRGRRRSRSQSGARSRSQSRNSPTTTPHPWSWTCKLPMEVSCRLRLFWCAWWSNFGTISGTPSFDLESDLK